MKKLFAALLAAVLAMGGAGGRPARGEDVISLYQRFGGGVRLSDVTENPETGAAQITAAGEAHALGLDFLSMAMVYNAETAEEYAGWKRLYLQRWNQLLPEIPLYLREDCAAHSSQAQPGQGPAWATEREDGRLAIGVSQGLTGQFHRPAPGTADSEIARLITGLETVTETAPGNYAWNDTAVASHSEAVHPDGSKTFTVALAAGLRFSDGSPVTARDYLAFPLALATPVAAMALGEAPPRSPIAGWDAFARYDGTEESLEGGASRACAGLRLIDDLTFSVTVSAEYLPYYFDLTYAGFSARYAAPWLAGAELRDDGEGVYLTGPFYARTEEGAYAAAPLLAEALHSAGEPAPCSGPYCLASYDGKAGCAELAANTFYPGGTDGARQLVYRALPPEELTAALADGRVDVITGLSGSSLAEARALADESGGAFLLARRPRAGYGRLAFRTDRGPARFPEVRLALAACLDRGAIARALTESGVVPEGPVLPENWPNQEPAPAPCDPARAAALLEAGGWVYNEKGEPYTAGVRYKRLPADALTDADRAWASLDGAWTVTEIDGFCYLPLALNWFGTEDCPLTEQLRAALEHSEALAAAGFCLQGQTGDFSALLAAWEADPVAEGPAFSCFSFAADFPQPLYDWAYAWAPGLALRIGSPFALVDEADVYQEPAHP